MRRRWSTTGWPGSAGNAFSGGALVGPGLLFDTNRFYVVFVDALGLFGASKPSDGLGRKFPVYSYYDVVHLNYRLLRDHLKVGKVVLATGVSMGATQAYYWGLMYPGLRSGGDARRRRHGHRRRGPGRGLDLPAREGGARGRPGVGEDQGQLLQPAEGAAPEQGRRVPLVGALADRLRPRPSAEPGLGRGVEGGIQLAARPAAGQERRRQSRQPGQDLRRGRSLVPRHRRRDPQHQRAAARHEAAHPGRSRRQRPVADLRQGACGSAGDPRRAVREPVEPDRALRGVQRAQHAGRRPDAQHLRARHRHHRGQDQGLRRRQLPQPARQHEARSGQVVLEGRDGVAVPGQVRQGQGPARRRVGDRLHRRVLRQGARTRRCSSSCMARAPSPRTTAT